MALNQFGQKRFGRWISLAYLVWKDYPLVIANRLGSQTATNARTALESIAFLLNTTTACTDDFELKKGYIF